MLGPRDPRLSVLKVPRPHMPRRITRQAGETTCRLYPLPVCPPLMARLVAMHALLALILPAACSPTHGLARGNARASRADSEPLADVLDSVDGGGNAPPARTVLGLRY